MRMTSGRYYRALFGGLALIAGVLFLWRFAQTPSVGLAVEEFILPLTLGIWAGLSNPGVLFYVVVSLALMGYGLIVRKRYALTLFWCGFVLFVMAGTMGLRMSG